MVSLGPPNSNPEVILCGKGGLDGLRDFGELETTPSNIRVTREENDVKSGVLTFLITEGGNSLAFLSRVFSKEQGVDTGSLH